MDVIVSPRVPTSTKVRRTHKLAKKAFKNNCSVAMVTDDDCELIAIIVPGPTAAELFVEFAWRSRYNRQIRSQFGITDEERSVALAKFLPGGEFHQDVEMFTLIVARAHKIAEASRSQPDVKTLQ